MPTADFCCGAECGITSGGAILGSAHWRGPTGPIAISTAVARNGGQSYRFTPVAELSAMSQFPASYTHRWWRCYIRFESLPTQDCILISPVLVDGANQPWLKFRVATSDIIAAVGVTTTGATAQVVTTGVWYLIDFETDFGTTTRTASLTVDGADKGTASVSTTATSSTQWNIGAATRTLGTNPSADLYIDDILSGTADNYPVGEGQIVGLHPNADGTHSFNNAGDFIYGAAGANIATDATDTYSYLDHTLASISDFLNAAAAATSEYLEWSFADLPSTVSSINGLQWISAHHAAGTAANLQTARLVDAGTVVDVFTDVDFSVTSIAHYSKHYAVAPDSGVAWTKADVDALKARWGSSFTAADVTPDAYIDAVILEVDYVPSAEATRFYFTHANAASVSPAVDAAWEQTIGSFVRRRLTLTKDEDTMQTHAALFGSTSTGQTVWGQWLSAPLDVNQTIDQPVSIVMRCQEGSLAEDAHLAFSLRVIKPDLTVRGTLKVQHATATEFPTTGATRIHSAVATSSVSALAGDRICMEVGVHGVTPANVDSITLEYGADSNSGDHALAEGNTDSLNAWFEIGQVLTFDPEPHIGSGSFTAALVASIAGTATQKFVGTGAPTTSLGASGSGDATLTFTGTGAPTKALGASMSATGGGASIFGSGSFGVTLVASMVATATNEEPEPGEISPDRRARGWGRRVIYEIEPEPEEKPRPKPKPVPEATPLAELPTTLPALVGPTFDPEMWHRMAQFRVNAPAFAEPIPEPTPEDPSDRLMRQLMSQAETPAFTMIDDGDDFLEHFLRMLGMELE